MGLSLKTGALGFEPRNVETKTRCLTTWRRPINFIFVIIADRFRVLSTDKISNYCPSAFERLFIQWLEGTIFRLRRGQKIRLYKQV